MRTIIQLLRDSRTSFICLASPGDKCVGLIRSLLDGWRYQIIDIDLTNATSSEDVGRSLRAALALPDWYPPMGSGHNFLSSLVLGELRQEALQSTLCINILFGNKPLDDLAYLYAALSHLVRLCNVWSASSDQTNTKAAPHLCVLVTLSCPIDDRKIDLESGPLLELPVAAKTESAEVITGRLH